MNEELQELIQKCERCEHRDSSKDTADTISRENCFFTHCMNCPVYSDIEGVYEGMAEAACS